MLSFFCSNSSTLEQGTKIKSKIVANYPSVASAVIVPTTFTTHSTSTITSTEISRPFIGAKHVKVFFDRARRLATPDMDSFRERLHAEGISE